MNTVIFAKEITSPFVPIVDVATPLLLLTTRYLSSAPLVTLIKDPRNEPIPLS